MNPVTHFWLKSGKVRELESQKVREGQEALLKELGGNPVIIISNMGYWGYRIFQYYSWVV